MAGSDVSALDAADGDPVDAPRRDTCLGRGGVQFVEHPGDSEQLLGLSTTAKHGSITFIGRNRIPPEKSHSSGG
jgi:hypothetical protein